MSVPALVMNCLVPLMTHSPPSSRARVCVLPASDPASGSVSPKAPEHLAAAQPRHVALLLLLGAEQVDRLGAERGVRAERDRDRRIDARELLDHHRVVLSAASRAAVLLRERDPHQVELGELANDLVRECLVPVEVLGDRRDFGPSELAHGVAQELLVCGEFEVHAGTIRSSGVRAAASGIAPVSAEGSKPCPRP